jgi:hypothetical protein
MSREDRFRELCEEFGLAVERSRPAYSGEEDAQAYLDPENMDYVLERYCTVTHSGEYAYLSCHASLEEAQARAFYFCNDQTYAESPDRVVDLDIGTVYVPDFARTPWKAIAPAREGA